jgi:streptogramin lyase
MKHISAVLVAVLACGACAPTDSSQSELAAFHDGAWMLVVDRTLRPGSGASGLPEAPLSESDFAPATGTTTYRVEVSEQGARIVVTEPRLVGRLETATPESRTYQIVEGSFAGGRFVASQVSGGLQGELTMYGSGLPVVRSERGPLRQVR